MADPLSLLAFCWAGVAGVATVCTASQPPLASSTGFQRRICNDYDVVGDYELKFAANPCHEHKLSHNVNILFIIYIQVYRL